MAEILVDYDAVLVGPDGLKYGARACGRAREDGLWEGWLEFPVIGGAAVVRTARETTQPNRDDLMYWATGLTASYLDGALLRAVTPAPTVERPLRAPHPAFNAPADHVAIATSAAAPRAVLDPFQVYAEGDEVLRTQLYALSPPQLRNIVRAYDLSTAELHDLERMTEPELVSVIMRGVEQRTL